MHLKKIKLKYKPGDNTVHLLQTGDVKGPLNEHRFEKWNVGNVVEQQF